MVVRLNTSKQVRVPLCPASKLAAAMPQRSSVVSRLIMFVGKTLIHVNIRIYLGPNIYFHLRLLYTIVRSDENICKFTQHTDGAARREFFEICTSFLKKAFLKSSTVIKEV